MSSENAANDIFLLSYLSHFPLARQIENEFNNNFQKRKIVFKDIIQWKRFENNFPNIFIENVRDLIDQDVIFIASLHKPSVIFEQLSVMTSLPRYLVKSLTILLPFFPCGTMEKIDKEGQIATAKTVATLLSTIPLTKCGPVQIIIYDIHALQERFYFGDSIIPRLESCIPLLFPEIQKLQQLSEKVSIVFPDEGSKKRFNLYFNENPHGVGDHSKTKNDSVNIDEIIVCSKTRSYKLGTVVKISHGDPKGYHVIILDDLINTGNTIVECAKKCFEAGAFKVSVYVTHALFPNESWKRFLEPMIEGDEHTRLDNFWITNSIPHAGEICMKSKETFKLLSFAKIFNKLF